MLLVGSLAIYVRRSKAASVGDLVQSPPGDIALPDDLDALSLMVLEAVLDATNFRFYVWSRTAEPAPGQ
jgi:hypothetical protein